MPLHSNKQSLTPEYGLIKMVNGQDRECPHGGPG